ncbi:MAG: hypothetical protein IJ220_07325 [Clostridia bacterium]|nr:hypothetical protein [Clostridia bacterium]
MNKSKIISITIGIMMIIILIIMPFHLKQICYEYSIHTENSLGAWNVVQIQSAMYNILIGILTIILVIINVLRKSK